MDPELKYEKLKKSSKSSLLISSFGLLLIIAALIYSFIQLNRLQTEKTKLKYEISNLDSTKKELRQEIDSLNRVKQSLAERLSVSNEIILTDKNISKEQLEKNISDTTAKFAPRIYIHIKNESQRKLALKTGKMFQSNGYVVPGVENVGNISPPKTQVRYFRRTEQEERDVVQIVKHLEMNGIRAEKKLIRLSDVSKIKPRHYELWFGLDIN